MTVFAPTDVLSWLCALVLGLGLVTTEHVSLKFIELNTQPQASAHSALNVDLPIPLHHPFCCHEAGCALESCVHALTAEEHFIQPVQSTFFAAAMFTLVSQVFQTPYPPPKS